MGNLQTVRPINLKNKTIAVMYMLYFGDLISITPFLEVLRRAAEGSKILLIIDSKFLDAVRYNPNVDEIIPVDRHGAQRSMAAAWKAGRDIGRLHPDLLITLHGTGRSSVMSYAMRPRIWVGEKGMASDRLLMDRILTIETWDCHAVDKYLHVLQQIGVEDISHTGLHTYTSPEWDRKADEFYAFAGVTAEDRLAGFNIGSSTPEKNWPAANYGKVADHFAEMGMKPVFFGIQSEMPLVERALSGMKHRERAVIATGKFTVGELMSAIGKCTIFFTNDSGPMYVADSRGVPTVALFGPSNAGFHHPIGRHSAALSSWEMPEGPEHVNQTIASGNYVPIDRIPVEEVITEGEQILRRLREEDQGK